MKSKSKKITKSQDLKFINLYKADTEKPSSKKCMIRIDFSKSQNDNQSSDHENNYNKTNVPEILLNK